MWVKVIGTRAVPYVGQPGTVRNIDRPSAKALVLLGKVVPVDPPTAEPAIAEATKPKAEQPKAAKPKTTKKAETKKPAKQTGTYRRRDLRAEKPASDD